MVRMQTKQSAQAANPQSCLERSGRSVGWSERSLIVSLLKGRRPQAQADMAAEDASGSKWRATTSLAWAAHSLHIAIVREIAKRMFVYIPRVKDYVRFAELAHLPR